VRGEYYDPGRNPATGLPIPVSPAILTIFNGLSSPASPLAIPVNLNVTEQQFRYRVFEFTVPLRNMLLLAGA